MTDKQPEALRLADVFDKEGYAVFTDDMHKAAAELRRLHAENEDFRATCDHLIRENAEQIGEIVALKEQRNELLEAAAELRKLRKLRKLRGIAQRLIRERAINREGSLRDTARIAELESQRNELLEALQGYMAGIEAMGWNTDKARSAIAKATGANND